MDAPENLRYTEEHEWLRVDADSATVGITAYAASNLGDVVYVELPEAGTQLTAGAIVGELESTKSVGELFAPVSGTVTENNQAVVDDPSLINSDPYGEGWLFKVSFTEIPELLTADEYEARFSE